MRSIRISLAIIVSLLVAIGIVMIFSSSGIYALREYGDGLFFLKRHFIFLCFGFALTFFVMSCDYRELQPLAKPLLMMTFMLLILVLIPGIGREAFGARRWFHVGPFNFQPSELAKIVMIIYMADYLSRKKHVLKQFWMGFVPALCVLGACSLLILKQPDLGNTVSIGLIVMTLIFIAGARKAHMLGLVLASIPILYVLVVNVPYRMRRIIAFLDPWQDSQGVGFQLTQAQIAFGSGGFFGTGLGKSIQKLSYLPAAHTDFILSIVGEEVGFLGVLVVIILFALLIWQGARLCKRINNPFGYYLAIGIVMMIGLQAVVNIGVSIGALPTKGLPLPFISYGGSALIMNMMAVGLLLNISKIEETAS